MCKTVYLTSKRFDTPANNFKKALAGELRARGVEVVVDYAYDWLNFLRSHKTFGIAIAFNFYRDGESGSSLTLNKNCSAISREFNYNLSNAYDTVTPNILWRDFTFVSSNDKEWFKYFNKISSNIKSIFYLCTYTNKRDWENFSLEYDKIIKVFADEIIRCLRSDYKTDDYRKRVKASRIRTRKLKHSKDGSNI